MTPPTSSKRTGLLAALSVVGLGGLLAAVFLLTGSTHGRVATRASQVPRSATTTASPPPSATLTPTAACEDLLQLVSSVNWQVPTLSVGQLETYAVPALAQQLAAAYHVTPGEIAARTVELAKATTISVPIQQHGVWVVPVQVDFSPSYGVAVPSTSWICRVARTPAGWRVDTLDPLGVG